MVIKHGLLFFSVMLFGVDVVDNTNTARYLEPSLS